MEYEKIQLIESIRVRIEANRENLLQRAVIVDKNGRKNVYVPPGLPAIDRFIDKVLINSENGCWEWQGAKSYIGYGQFKPNASRKDTERTSPHRFIYKFIFGEIPEGFEIDHLCRNRACSNPYHLSLKTHQENMAVAASDRRKEKMQASKQVSLI